MQSKSTETQDFLNAMYGQAKQGYFTLWTPDRKTKWFSFNEMSLAIEESMKLSEKQNVYYGVGLRKERLAEWQRGASKDVYYLPSVWVEIDLKSGEHAAKNLPSSEDVNDILNSFPLEVSIVNHSGGGYHCYWLFKYPVRIINDEDHDSADRLIKRFQNVFIQLAKQKGLHIDNTSDLARVLRVPGTLNFKSNPPKPVRNMKLKEECRYTLPELKEAIEKVENKMLFPNHHVPDNKKATSTDDLPDAKAEPIIKGCKFIQSYLNNKDSATYGEWIAALSIGAHCEDHETLCHSWSEGHNGYSEKETNQKINEIRSRMKPRTCASINADFGSCEGCNYFNKINSPIALGMRKDEFQLYIGENPKWREKLEYGQTKNGDRYLLKNGRNVELILKNIFKQTLAFDAFKNSEVIKDDLPWRKRELPQKEYEAWLSSDDSRLQHWFETKWNVSTKTIIQNAYIEVTRQNSFHPVKEYLETQRWDGMERVETFFIDYLGAEDTPYIRAVTRKWLTAAVTRIYEPGCKFDYMPVLVGPQGAKKSSTIAKLAMDWFSDSLKNFESKDAGEHLQSSWIFEFGELAAMKKGEVEEIKAFITKTTDKYRVAYDRIVSEFPRKCVFIGTTNKHDFLRDRTGNRRFWAITVDPKERKFDPTSELTKDVVGQIWAEAMELYKSGEKLYLDQALEEEAMKIQDQHMEDDPRAGLIQKYLNTPLPSHWDSMSIYERRTYFDKPTGDIERTQVCAAEIWSECLENDYKNMRSHEAREICDIIRKIKGWKERKPSRTRFKHYGSQKTFVKI